MEFLEQSKELPAKSQELLAHSTDFPALAASHEVNRALSLCVNALLGRHAVGSRLYWYQRKFLCKSTDVRDGFQFSAIPSGYASFF